MIFHKCEFAAEFSSVAGRRHTADSGCLVNVERLLRGGRCPAASAQHGYEPCGADPQCIHGGVMHEWVQPPKSYDLARPRRR